MPSFTSQLPNLLETGPIVEVNLSVGAVIEDVLKREGQTAPPPVSVLAMIDTGATRTVVREQSIVSLNLKPVGVALISTPSTTSLACFEYLVRLVFPNNVTVETVIIAAPLEGQHIQYLIGRDVLSFGVLVYVGYTNTFTLSF